LFASLAGATIIQDARLPELAKRLRAAASTAMAQADNGDVITARDAAETAQERGLLQLRIESLQLGNHHVPIRLQHLQHSATLHPAVVESVRDLLVNFCNDLIQEAWPAAHASKSPEASESEDEADNSRAIQVDSSRLVRALRGYREQYLGHGEEEGAPPLVTHNMVRVCGILEGSLVLFFTIDVPCPGLCTPLRYGLEQGLVEAVADASDERLDESLGRPAGAVLSMSNPLARIPAPPSGDVLDIVSADDRVEVALEEGSVEVLATELDAQPARDLNAPFAFSSGGTVLHRAAAVASDPMVIDVLVDRGARADMADDLGRLPIHVGLAHGNIQVVQRLLREHEHLHSLCAAGVPLQRTCGTTSSAALPRADCSAG
jgi:hypothetical protein